MGNSSSFKWVTMFAVLLALTVVMLGAYTRLSDAGLGCPDWPGCYGKIAVPENVRAVQAANKLFPSTPVEAPKAWKEMVHRYFAGTLGLLILWIAVRAFLRRKKISKDVLAVSFLLIPLVIFQAALGMWTVTWKLLPLIVMSHLMGGMTILAALGWVALSAGNESRTLLPNSNTSPLKVWAILGLLIVFAQIFLGAWTSTNYAALACPNFPYCQGTFFPHLDLKQAFNFAAPIGPNYDGGDMNMQARVTLQMIHRYGAFMTAGFCVLFSLLLISVKKFKVLRPMGWILLLVVLLQFLLGVLNVELTLPIANAVAHNGGAAILLLTMVTIVYKVFKTYETQEAH